eukprot:3412857-Amphidinium_carterae.2
MPRLEMLALQKRADTSHQNTISLKSTRTQGTSSAILNMTTFWALPLWQRASLLSSELPRPAKAAAAVTHAGLNPLEQMAVSAC